MLSVTAHFKAWLRLLPPICQLLINPMGPMKKWLKSTMLKFCPELFYALSSLAFFLRCKKQFERFQIAFHREVFAGKEIRVLAGPFKGLRYYNKIVWGPITPKWIGCYEAELHSVIAEILAGAYTTIVDVGAAEGYYAVGLACMKPDARVITYDIDPIARHRQRQLAKLNAIANLSIMKECDHCQLEAQCVAGTLVLADVEGFELELLDPAKAPSLKRCDIIVELHRSQGKTIAEVEAVFVERFGSTHAIQAFSEVPRNPESWKSAQPELSALSLETIAKALNEHRGYPQRWFWMKCLNRDEL